MKEFSSYIAEVLKIIRNSKLLKKFKNFIEKEAQDDIDPLVLAEDNQILQQMSQREGHYDPLLAMKNSLAVPLFEGTHVFISPPFD